MANDSKMMFPLSAEMKSAMGAYATAHDESIASMIRRAVCKEIGFVEAPSTTVTRHKYASEEERKAAQDARNAEKKALVNQLLAEYNKAHAK